jgi:general transcription factor 3C polypeptide 3 (transcription factor C subunit 4)
MGRHHRYKVFALDEDKAKAEKLRSAHLAEQWEYIRRSKDDYQLSDDLGPGETWMDVARELVDDFRSYKPFYPWERYLVNMGLKQDHVSTSSVNPSLVKMADRLRDNLDPTRSGTKKVEEVLVSYRNVEFKEWLELFLELALALAHAGKVREAYLVCDSAKDANVFFENTEDLFLIHIAMGACALRARDEETCVEVARYLMSKNFFTTDAYRMYAALCRLGTTSAQWYADTRVQKFLLRQIKYMDANLLPEEQRGRPLTDFEDKNYPGDDVDIHLLMLYGHILFISNSFTYALNYYVRAYALDQDNPMINVSIGQAYVHHALKRQSENRQHLIAQGFSFLHKYYDSRLRDAVSPLQRQEAHYNLGRSYHLLGLTSLAIEYYKRTLRESEFVEGGLGTEDLAREAAYNIATMCVIGGDMRAAQEVTDQWLVL